MLVLLDINNITLGYQDDDLIKIIYDIAAGISDYQDLLSWLIEHALA